MIYMVDSFDLNAIQNTMIMPLLDISENETIYG